MTGKLHLALPVLNEFENLPALVKCLEAQTEQDFTLWVCVNNYDFWHEIPEKKHIIENNQRSIDFFNKVNSFEIRLIDKASHGKGWKRKKGGVGMARKTVMDSIAGEAGNNDIIVSIDADTFYPPDYLRGIKNSLQNHPDVFGMSVPYYHPLGDNEENNRLILRYEIYMRNYALNMLRIKNPYAFSALGSAMAFPVWAYKKVGGLTPVVSGEDFYFLQKLAKSGKVLIHSELLAKPSARLSDRVIFGTGPALIKGASGDWNSYPIYHYSLFDKIKKTFDLFPKLYYEDIPTPLDDFLKNQFNGENIWEPLRKNYKDINNFVRACINKIDGLRILQFLRIEQEKISQSDDEITEEFLVRYFSDYMDYSFKKHLKGFDFYGSALCFVDMVRDFMYERETALRKKMMFCGNSF